jgi:hypothetical protein
MKNFTIAIPVFNDWDNLNRLLKKINLIAKKNSFEFNILIINDFSTIKQKINFKKNIYIKKLDVLNLDKNLGSQRAIAVALNYLFKQKKKIKHDIVIMDADGQDDPNVIKNLIYTFKKNYPDIVVVERTNRNEPFWFIFLYSFHKIILFIFTGNYIKFGNFSLISFRKIKNIINRSDLWAAYPAAIVNNLNNIKKIQSERKKRYSGNSKVNLNKLFNHSSRVFSVFKNKILVTSIVYCYVLYFILGYDNLIFYFFTISIIIANLYNFYIDFTNKKDFKNNNKLLKAKLRKIF